jgi:hypothetical protein
MVDPTSIAVGAVAVYAIIVHMTLAYLYAARQAGEDSLSASEADLAGDEA